MTGVLGELSTVAVEHAVDVSGFWTDPLQPSPRTVGSRVTSCAAATNAAPAAALLPAVGFASPPFR